MVIFFFSDPNALKADQKSVTTYDSIFTSLTTDTKGNLEPQFLAASLTERTLQFYFISYVSYTSCPDKCVTKSKSTWSYQIAFDYLSLNNVSTFHHPEEELLRYSTTDTCPQKKKKKPIPYFSPNLYSFGLIIQFLSCKFLFFSVHFLPFNFKKIEVWN